MSLHRESEQIKSCAPATCQLSGAKPKQAGPPRDTAIDFTKGGLVLFMVLYHWLNYFVGPRGQYYNYLRFLTPSFIFISGFMISQIQLRRYESSGRHLASRLIVRGFKLLILVLLLNICSVFALSRFDIRYGASGEFWRNICLVLIVADPTASLGHKSAYFSILVPIA
jgi:peptidoglycan/LPS O-acetylase OafA/YrhL